MSTRPKLAAAGAASRQLCTQQRVLPSTGLSPPCGSGGTARKNALRQSREVRMDSGLFAQERLPPLAQRVIIAGCIGFAVDFFDIYLLLLCHKHLARSDAGLA